MLWKEESEETQQSRFQIVTFTVFILFLIHTGRELHPAASSSISEPQESLEETLLRWAKEKDTEKREQGNSGSKQNSMHAARML